MGRDSKISRKSWILKVFSADIATFFLNVNIEILLIVQKSQTTA